MTLLGYHASHEQFTPSDLLRWATLAEKAGFHAVNSSDHFHPWSERQGQSGFSFAWLGAAMQATNLPFGVVCSPGYRYHPALLAQAGATLAEMFPGRFWMSVGSGEALNERITGQKWPVKSVRNERLLECVSIIRRLWKGETVTHHGLITVEHARLYTLPRITPLLIGAALTPQTAQWLGGWADGMITVSRDPKELKEIVSAFHRGGGLGKPMYLKVQLSFDNTKEEALQGAYDQWRTNIFSGTVLGDLWQVEQFDAVGKMVQPADMYSAVRISHDPEKHREWIQQDIDLGFEKIILHNVNRNQENFIHRFGEKVLPRLT